MTSEGPIGCVRCGNAFEQTSGRGRPKRYCSTSCRRAAEFEIKRVNRHLGAAEFRLAHWQERLEQIRRGVGALGTEANAEEQIEFVERRVAELNERLEALLAQSG